VVVRCNDTDTSWTLVCDGDVWRSLTVAVTNCSTTAALTGDNGPTAYIQHIIYSVSQKSSNLSTLCNFVKFQSILNFPT